MTASVPTEAVAPVRICPRCGREIPAAAEVCGCGRYTKNWKRWAVLIAGVPSVILTLNATRPVVSGWFVRESRTEVTFVGTDDDPALLAVKVSNTGNKEKFPSFLELSLESSRPEVITFGILTRLTPDGKLAASGGAPTTVLFDISHIHSPFDVRSADFWAKHSALAVTLRGKVTESNGSEREISHTAPLRNLREFVKYRADPIPEAK